VAGQAGRTGERAGYPYLWYFDNRQADPSDGWADADKVRVVCNQVLPIRLK